jgi:hypothetical protein
MIVGLLPETYFIVSSLLRAPLLMTFLTVTQMLSTRVESLN